MAEKNYGNDLQLAEIVKYISDNMKVPILGAGGGYAPIGTINFFDATVAPLGWLACDGSTHNISDYPDLATFYASVHGASNFYGGNGTTTFAVPNLQGEFLRGAGTNGHTNQGNGGSVGEHQDATEHNWIKGTPSSGELDVRGSLGSVDYFTPQKRDGGINGDGATNQRMRADVLTTTGTTSAVIAYTSRPTNTSFLICVKATLSDTELNNMHVYSPNEHQVGWWQEKVDGVLKQKPVWEVYFSATSPSSDSIIKTITGVSTVVDIRGFIVAGSNQIIPIQWAYSSSYSTVYFTLTNGTLKIRQTSTPSTYQGKPEKITIQYTKTTDTWQTV